MAAPQNKLDRARRLLLRAVDLVSDDDAGSIANCPPQVCRRPGHHRVQLYRWAVKLQLGCEESRAKYLKTVLHKSRRSSNGCSGLIQEREESERQPQLSQAQQ